MSIGWVQDQEAPSSTAADREDDRAALRRLARACRSGAVEIRADFKRLQHVHSPVLSQADGNQWLLGLAAALGALWWTLGWGWALGGLPAAVALYATLGRRAVRTRLMRRVERRLDDPESWGKLWNFGGVTLIDPLSGRSCVAPEGDWRSIAGPGGGSEQEGVS